MFNGKQEQALKEIFSDTYILFSIAGMILAINVYSIAEFEDSDFFYWLLIIVAMVAVAYLICDLFFRVGAIKLFKKINILKYLLVIFCTYIGCMSWDQKTAYINQARIDNIKVVIDQYQPMTSEIVTLKDNISLTNLADAVMMSEEVGLLKEFYKKTEGEAVYSEELYYSLDTYHVNKVIAVLSNKFTDNLSVLDSSLLDGRYIEFKQNFVDVSASVLKKDYADRINIIKWVFIIYMILCSLYMTGDFMRALFQFKKVS